MIVVVMRGCGRWERRDRRAGTGGCRSRPVAYRARPGIRRLRDAVCQLGWGAYRGRPGVPRAWTVLRRRARGISRAAPPADDRSCPDCAADHRPGGVPLSLGTQPWYSATVNSMVPGSGTCAAPMVIVAENFPTPGANSAALPSFIQYPGPCGVCVLLPVSPVSRLRQFNVTGSWQSPTPHMVEATVNAAC